MQFDLMQSLANCCVIRGIKHVVTCCNWKTISFWGSCNSTPHCVTQLTVGRHETTTKETEKIYFTTRWEHWTHFNGCPNNQHSTVLYWIFSSCVVSAICIKCLHYKIICIILSKFIYLKKKYLTCVFSFILY